jgi:hypothetical protein
MHTSLKLAAFVFSSELLIAAAASAHPQTSFSSLGYMRGYTTTFDTLPRSRPAVHTTGSSHGAERAPRAGASGSEIVNTDGQFPWVFAPMFNGFDAIQLKVFDPRTGDSGVYAEVDPAGPKLR